MPISLDDYDRARTAVDTAQADMDAAMALYAEAKSKYEAVSHGFAILRRQMNEALRHADLPGHAELPSESTSTIVDRRGHFGPPAPTTTGAGESAGASPRALRQMPPPPPGVRMSLWELIVAIPLEGAAALVDLREALGLSEGALGSRVTQAKTIGLIEGSGWGRYQLTEEGRKLRQGGLRVV